MALNRLSVSKAREQFTDVLAEVSVKGERVVLHKRVPWSKVRKRLAL